MKALSSFFQFLFVGVILFFFLFNYKVTYNSKDSDNLFFLLQFVIFSLLFCSLLIFFLVEKGIDIIEVFLIYSTSAIFFFTITNKTVFNNESLLFLVSLITLSFYV